MHEHPVGGLEDEREGGGFLEREVAGDRMDEIARDRDQLGMRAVHRLAHDVGLAARDDPRIDHDALVGAGDHACAVGAEDARLRHRGEPLADPDVEVVQRGGSQLDQHLAVGGLRIGDVLVAEHLRPAVLVDANGFHRGTILA